MKEHVKNCIAACQACATECNTCLVGCIGSAEMAHCARHCLDCAEDAGFAQIIVPVIPHL